MDLLKPPTLQPPVIDIYCRNRLRKRTVKSQKRWILRPGGSFDAEPGSVERLKTFVRFKARNGWPTEKCVLLSEPASEEQDPKNSCSFHSFCLMVCSTQWLGCLVIIIIFITHDAMMIYIISLKWKEREHCKPWKIRLKLRWFIEEKGLGHTHSLLGTDHTISSTCQNEKKIVLSFQVYSNYVGWTWTDHPSWNGKCVSIFRCRFDLKTQLHRKLKFRSLKLKQRRSMSRPWYVPVWPLIAFDWKTSPNCWYSLKSMVFSCSKLTDFWLPLDHSGWFQESQD